MLAGAFIIIIPTGSDDNLGYDSRCGGISQLPALLARISPSLEHDLKHTLAIKPFNH